VIPLIKKIKNIKQTRRTQAMTDQHKNSTIKPNPDHGINPSKTYSYMTNRRIGDKSFHIHLTKAQKTRKQRTKKTQRIQIPPPQRKRTPNKSRKPQKPVTP
jgi:hypothetical protein